jgi:hypothetical protein
MHPWGKLPDDHVTLLLSAEGELLLLFSARLYAIEFGKAVTNHSSPIRFVLFL